MSEDVKASWPLKPPSPSCQIYKHLSREERYQIHSLLKAKQTINVIARSLGRSRSTISRELSRGRSQRVYGAEQACAEAYGRAQRSRNARRVDSKVWSYLDFPLAFNSAPSRLQARWRLATSALTCMCMRTRPPVVIYTRTCSAKSPGANATCVGDTGVARSRTAARSARNQATLKIPASGPLGGRNRHWRG